MRGLTYPRPLADAPDHPESPECEARPAGTGLSPALFRRPLFRRAGAAAAGAAAAGLLAAGCSATGTGVREEGPVDTGSPTAVTSTPPSESPDRVDAVRLVKTDPKVSTEIRKGLKPCAPDEYPVDVSYGTLTGNSEPDVVVNVLTCGDSFGVGSYVYRHDDADGGSGTDSYTNVFTDESSPVYAEITGGELEVSKQIYSPGDKVCCPSGEDVITYRWAGERFDERARTHNDFSKAAGGGTETGPEPED